MPITEKSVRSQVIILRSANFQHKRFGACAEKDTTPDKGSNSVRKLQVKAFVTAPGELNLFSFSFLNSFSAHRLLSGLKRKETKGGGGWGGEAGREEGAATQEEEGGGGGRTVTDTGHATYTKYI